MGNPAKVSACSAWSGVTGEERYSLSQRREIFIRWQGYGRGGDGRRGGHGTLRNFALGGRSIGRRRWAAGRIGRGGKRIGG